MSVLYRTHGHMIASDATKIDAVIIDIVAAQTVMLSVNQAGYTHPYVRVPG